MRWPYTVDGRAQQLVKDGPPLSGVERRRAPIERRCAQAPLSVCSANGGLGLTPSPESPTPSAPATALAMGCRVKVSRHNTLALRLYWNGREWWEGTGLRDSRAQRDRVERIAAMIDAEI